MRRKVLRVGRQKKTSNETKSQRHASTFFVPVGWSCKEQVAVSHSSTEAETISLDAGLSLGGIPALKLWDLVTDVVRLHNKSQREEVPNVERSNDRGD